MLAVHPEAALDIAAAAAWYAAQRPETEERFLAELDRRVVQATAFPASEPPVRGIAPRFDARAFGLRRFPFSLVTAMVNGQRLIIAVAHARRAPGYWRERL
jgi:hypothetical protein